MPAPVVQARRAGRDPRGLGHRARQARRASIARVVALDSDVGNSTFSDRFEKSFPDRFYQNFIAEQVMVGAAMGLAARGAIAFATTFACFLTRASDFIRMADCRTPAIS